MSGLEMTPLLWFMATGFGLWCIAVVLAVLRRGRGREEVPALADDPALAGHSYETEPSEKKSADGERKDPAMTCCPGWRQQVACARPVYRCPSCGRTGCKSHATEACYYENFRDSQCLSCGEAVA